MFVIILFILTVLFLNQARGVYAAPIKGARQGKLLFYFYIFLKKLKFNLRFYLSFFLKNKYLDGASGLIRGTLRGVIGAAVKPVNNNN